MLSEAVWLGGSGFVLTFQNGAVSVFSRSCGGVGVWCASCDASSSSRRQGLVFLCVFLCCCVAAAQSCFAVHHLHLQQGAVCVWTD